LQKNDDKDGDIDDVYVDDDIIENSETRKPRSLMLHHYNL